MILLCPVQGPWASSLELPLHQLKKYGRAIEKTEQRNRTLHVNTEQNNSTQYGTIKDKIGIKLELKLKATLTDGHQLSNHLFQ